jgi:hypothetical protein
MKRIFTLILVFLAATQLQASPRFAAPSNPATNLTALAADGDRIQVQWTNGNGAKRIVIARKDAPVTAVPVNGTNYNANASFLLGNEIAPGEFVVYNGTGNVVSVVNLLSSTHYYFAVFEYNGTGAGIEYGAAATVNGQTVTPPTGQPVNLSVNTITGHSMKLNWAAPALPNNGSGRIVLVREGAPVNANPTDLVDYFGQTTFGLGSQIGVGNYVVYQGNGTTTTIDELRPNITYYFSIFEYKGSSALVFNINNPPSISATTLSRPTQASTAMSFSGVDGNAMTLSITKGDGARRLVIMRAGSPVTAVPQDGVSYTASSIFGSGQQIAPGQYVVSSSTTASVAVSGLSIGTNYYFTVFEYDGTGSYTAYLTTSFSSSQTTVSAPTVAASNVSFSNITSSSFTINWQAGDGVRRLVVVRKTDPVNSVPANLTYYSTSSNFQSGSNVGPGNYSVYSNTGTSVTVTGLTGGSTYHVAIFEYNGNNAPVYLTGTYATASASLSLAPTAPATSLQFTTIEANRFSVQWQNGNGNRRIVVARAGSPVTAVPTDGVDYTANNSFTTAPELAPGQRIVYNNGSSAFILFNLDPGTTYYFAVYEYNSINNVNYYLTSSFASGSQSTVAVPDVNSTNLSFTNISGNSMKLNWTRGNGGNRIILLKAGSPVDVLPANFTSYTANTNLTLAAQLGNTGNYIVYNGISNNTTITGLDPDVTYYYKVFEYNGAAYPAYLTSGALAGSQKTNPRPSQTASGLNFYQVEGNKMTVRWTNGDGARRILVGRQGAPVTALPVDGTSYIANGAFGSGTALAPGQFVLFDNTYSETNVTNLLPNTDYYFAVFEYDGTGSNIRYQTAAFLNGNTLTVAAPTQASSNVLFSSITNNSLIVNWTPGNGDKHLVIVRKGAPVNAIPQNLQYYSALTSYGSASTIVSGDNYAVYNSTATSSPVVSLSPGTTYYFAVYDFNGFSGPVYNLVNPATGSATTLGPPADPATGVQFTNVGSNTTLKLSWTNGSGQKRLVLVKDNAPVDAVPVTGTLYNANSFFGSGDMIGMGNYSVYAGAADNITINNLVPGHTYYFAVFEYNQFATGPMYLTTNPARATFGGFALPVRLLSFSGAASATGNRLSWTTASEVNSSRFVVERSENGVDFTSIGTVAAVGNSSTERSYGFEDAGRTAAAHYRLRMEDIDGHMAYSKVIRLAQNNQPVSLEVYPTMANATVSVSIRSTQRQQAAVAIVDMQGRVMKQLARAVQEGVNEFDVEVSGLPKGSYVLQVMLGQQRLAQKFIRL